MRHRTTTILLVLLPTVGFGQSIIESMFYNLDGSGSSEYSVQSNGISALEIMKVSDTDTCLVEKIQYNTKGLILMRTEYDCAGVAYEMTYKEEYQYNEADSLIWESYLSVYNGETQYHYRTHDFTQTANGLEKTTVTKDANSTWDSTITFFDNTNRLMESLTYHFPKKNKQVTPVHKHYQYNGVLLTEIHIGSGDGYRYTFDKQGRMIAYDAVGLDGLFEESCVKAYSRTDNLVSIKHTFPYKTEFKFDFKQDKLHKKRFVEYDFEKRKDVIYELIYSYDQDGLVQSILLKDKAENTEELFLINHIFSNEIMITAHN